MATCPTCRRRYPPETTICVDDGEQLLEDAAFSAADSDLEAGTLVGEYRIEAKIGEGGFGCVYAAVHPLIGKRAAVKVLNRQWSSNPQMVSRFIAEARAVNQIRHKGIIDIFAFGTIADGRQYYVMELLDGMTLDSYLKVRGPLPPEEAIPILRQVARAIDAAHAAGIAHRDLKPENVFLTFDEDGLPEPKLLDFGIAKLMDEGAMSGHQTRTGTPMGTPHYMSPEQCRGQNVDPRTDIYSFGIMVYEALTGQLPFDGENVVELLFKQTSAPAPRMSSVRTELAAALDEPVLHMLEKDPAARPASLGVAVDELALAASHAGLAVRAVPVMVDMLRGSDLGARSGRTPAEQGSLAEARTMLGPESGSGATPASVALPPAVSTGAAHGGVERRILVAVGVPALILGVLVMAWFSLGRLQVAGGPSATSSAVAPGVAPASVVSAVAMVSPAMSAAPVVSAAPAVTPEPSGEVAITFDAQPAGTEVFLGTERLGTVPGPLRLRRDDKELTLTLKAAGFRPRDVPVVPSKDKELVAPPPVRLTVGTGVKAPVKHTGHGELENPFQ